MRDLDEAIRLEPRDPQGYNNRGTVHAEMGNHQKAIDDFSRALELDPGFASAHRNRGNAYLQMGDAVKAREDFHTAIELGPTEAERIPAEFRK